MIPHSLLDAFANNLTCLNTIVVARFGYRALALFFPQPLSAGTFASLIVRRFINPITVGDGLLRHTLGRARKPLERDRLNETARIDGYALIGDLHTAALISERGSLNWLCWPDFDSEACFAQLLGNSSHGFWSISPTTSGDIFLAL